MKKTFQSSALAPSTRQKFSIFQPFHFVPLFFFSFSVSSKSSRVQLFCFCFWTVRLLRMWPFFNPTIEVVTFHLHGTGRCMLGVFLLPVFRNFWVHPMACMCVQTRPLFILSSERVLRNEARTHVNSKGKIPSNRGSEEGWTRDAASCRTASQTHYYQLSYSTPPCHFSKMLLRKTERKKRKGIQEPVGSSVVQG